jgi:uncharacterized membrane protein HdeD (DUF308 family)
MYDKPLQTYETRVPPQPTPTWALVLINGIAAIGIGLIFLASPGATVRVLAKILGLFFLVGGMFSMFHIVINPEHWGWKLLAGLAGVIGGLIVMEHPLWSTLVASSFLVYALAGIGIVMGISNMVQAIRGGGWGVGILGVVYLLFGLILAFSSVIGAVALPFVLAAFGIIGGIIAIFVAFRIRRMDKEKSEGKGYV